MKIIGISGKKQSGKNTFANYVNGSILKKYGLVDDFSINKEGQLQVKTENAHGKKDWGILDITRKDDEFCSYAKDNIWPFVKVYHFADYLKKICVDLFDLTPQQVMELMKIKIHQLHMVKLLENFYNLLVRMSCVVSKIQYGLIIL